MSVVVSMCARLVLNEPRGAARARQTPPPPPLHPRHHHSPLTSHATRLLRCLSRSTRPTTSLQGGRVRVACAERFSNCLRAPQEARARRARQPHAATTHTPLSNPGEFSISSTAGAGHHKRAGTPGREALSAGPRLQARAAGARAERITSHSAGAFSQLLHVCVGKAAKGGGSWRAMSVCGQTLSLRLCALGCLLVFRRCKPNAIESVVLAQTNSGGRGGIRARFVWGRGRGQCFCGESASARLLKRSRLPIALVTRDIDSSLKHATLARCKQHAALARTPAERQIHLHLPSSVWSSLLLLPLSHYY